MAYDHACLLTISDVAKMLEVHPQTLRLYEREGFVKPLRTKGNTRRYSQRDVEQLRLVLRLTRDQKVNLAGVEIILEMRQKLTEVQQEIDQLRHALAEHMSPQLDLRNQRRALIKASSRMLIKMP